MFHAMFTPIVAIIFAWTALIACSSHRNEEAANLHRGKARDFLEKKQFGEALIEYQELLKLDPRDDDAYYQLALLHLRSGTIVDMNLAHQALLKVVKLKGSRIDAHLQLARLYFLSAEPDKAGLQADAILSVEPTHSNGHVIKGLSLIAEGRMQSGIAEFSKAIELDPNNRAAYIELARAYAQQRKFSEAETVLLDALKTQSQFIDARIALGDVYQSAGKEAEAIQEYRRGLEEDKNQGPLYARLAAVHQKAHRLEEAEGCYRQWVKAQPSSGEALVALAQFYTATGRFNEAEASFHRAREVDPTSRMAREALITFYLDRKRMKEARSEIEAFLMPNRSDVGGRVLEARLIMEEGDIEKALPLLEKLAHEAPRLAIVRHYLGVVWARLQDYSKAIAVLKEARDLAPNSSDIRVALVQTYLAHNSLSLALTEGEAAVQLDPQNVAALKALADAQIFAGNTKRAEDLLKQALTLQPHDALLNQRLGIVFRAQRRPTEALAYFARALQKDPGSLESLEQMTAILVSQKRTAEAREHVSRQISVYPSNAKLHHLLGRVLMEAQNLPQAEAAIKKAIALDKDYLSTYVTLGELYARQGKIGQAIHELEVVLRKSPEQPQILTLLGMLHEQQRDNPRAMARYEEALRINPNFAPAANNLAWILLDQVGDTERALSYAETAWKAVPSDPHIADTLGWVYFNRQMYPKAVSLLKEAAQALPDNPTVLYHYGMAQYWNDNNPEAKKILTKFLTLHPNGPDAHKARKVLDAL